MPHMILRIERISPRPGAVEEPLLTAKGYQLADPAHGKVKHHAEHAVHVRTLSEAADLIAKGFSMRMAAKGKRGSLVSPSGLRVLLA